MVYDIHLKTFLNIIWIGVVVVNDIERINRKNTIWYENHMRNWEHILLNGARNGIYKDVQKALAQGINPLVKDENGFTALQLANRGGHKEIAELIKKETDSFFALQKPDDKKFMNKPKQIPGDKTPGKRVKNAI